MQRLTRGRRAAGVIKQRPDDFRVEEILENGSILNIGTHYSPETLGMESEEGKFTIFVMQKSNWNTAQALKEVARRCRRGIKSTGFAGTKDRMSTSTQLCSMFGAEPEQLMNVRIKDIAINGAWKGNDKVKMGQLLGNRFGITVREASGYDSINSLLDELDGIFPNYFGDQRFGNRNTNVDIGLSMLKGDFEGAAMRFLTDAGSEANEEAIDARKRLSEERDFSKALDYFPGYLKYERMVIEYLARYPGNYANSIRRLPRSISLMFIHSVESHIFNMVLEQRVGEGSTKPVNGDIVCCADFYGFPDISRVEAYDGNQKNAFVVGNIIGYDSRPTEYENEMLDSLGLAVESFKAKGMGELGSKGAHRAMFAPFREAQIEKKESEFLLGFSLPAGSYATVLLSELLEGKN